MADLPEPQHLTFVTPTLGGIAGAAQLSTACTIQFPSSTTDFLLTGGVSPHFLWSVPAGALLGSALSWLLLWLPKRVPSRSAWFRNWAYATVVGFLVAPMAPGFLGLGPQTAAQRWEGLMILSGFTWMCVCVATLLERWIKRQA